MPEPTRVFISYSHDSDAHRGHVLWLATQLRAHGVDAWIDRYSPKPPEGWPLWMNGELRKAAYVIVVCSRRYREHWDVPSAKGSGAGWEATLIRQELYQRGGENHRFVPALFDDDESAVPQELLPYTRYRLPAEYDALFRHITDQPLVRPPSIGPLRTQPPLPIEVPRSEGARGDSAFRRWNVPSRPDQYLARAELNTLSSVLFFGGQQAVAVSGHHTRLGIQGMPGVGKTVLAIALATDDAVQRVFPGGVFWLTLGRSPEDPVLWQGQLAAAAGARVVEFRTSGQGKAELRDLFASRPPSLLILDDVWSIDHADPFNVVTAPSKLLITTRNREVASGLGAKIRELTELTSTDALTLLAAYAERPVDELPGAAPDIVRACGELPLAIAMAGSMLRGRPDDRWGALLERLQASDLRWLSAALPDYRQHQSMLAAIQASVDDLPHDPPDDVRSRFFDVAVCARYGPVPEPVLHRLWRNDGGGSSSSHSTIDALLDRALIQRAADGHLTLHNLQQDYVRACGGDLRPRHRRVVEAYRAEAPGGALHAVREDRYFFEHIAKHVREGEGERGAARLLFDVRWLSAKLRATEPNALLADFELLNLDSDEGLRLLRDALRLSAHVVGLRPLELPSQLLGRLRGQPQPELRALCAQIEDLTVSPALVPVWPSLTPPGGPLLCTLEGHQGLVQAVALSADGNTVVSGSEDRTLKVWNVATGKALRTLEGHEGRVLAVALSSNGKTAVSASADTTLRVWDVASGKAIRVLRGHHRPVHAVALSQDGKIAVSGSEDQTIKVWDVATGEVARTLEGHQASVRAVALGRDGRTAVSGSNDGTLKIWDAGTGKLLRILAGHKGWILAVALSDDMSTIVSGSDDKTLKAWDAVTGRVRFSLEGHEGWVHAVALGRDGKRVVSGSGDMTLRSWDLVEGKVSYTFRGHEGWVWAVGLSTDGRTAVSASDDMSLRVWDVSGEDLQPHDEKRVHVEEVALSGDGKTAVVASEEKALKVVDVATGETLRVLEGHRSWARAVAMSEDGATAISGSDDKTLKVWDVATGRTLRTLEGHQGWVQAVAMGRDGKKALSGSTDRTLRVWAVTTGQLLRTLEGHQGSVLAVALSGDGNMAVSASTEPAVLVWDVAEGRLARTLIGHQGSVLAVALSEGGETAVSGSTDKTVRIWDVATGKEAGRLEGHQGWVQAVALSRDGELVVSSSTDKTVRIWSARGGKMLASFTGESALTGLTLDASGHILAGDAGGRLHLLVLV